MSPEIVPNKRKRGRPPKRFGLSPTGQPRPRPLPTPEPPGYMFRAPVSPDQWMTVSSNKPMTEKVWRKFWAYMAVQREIALEDDAQGIEAGTDVTPQAAQPEGQEPGP
jgi:hypothetical protein